MAILESFVKETIGRNVNLREPILSRAAAVHTCKKMFIEILRGAKAKALFMSSYTGISERGLILACRELQIPTIDVQHGKQGSLNAHYGKWLNVPDDGYNIVPQFFWVWGQESADNIKFGDNSKSGMPRVVIGGNQYITKWLESDPFDYRSVNVDFWSRVDHAGRSILVSLQPFGLDQAIGDVLCEAIKNSNSNWLWLIRSHPNAGKVYSYDDIKSYLLNRGIGQDKFEIENASNTPLVPLLKNVNSHVTLWSSCGHEALLFGHQTIFIHPFAKVIYEDYMSKGYFLFAGSADSILEKISKTKIKDYKNVKPYIETNINVSRAAIGLILNSGHKTRNYNIAEDRT